MIQDIDLVTSPEVAFEPELLRKKLISLSGASNGEPFAYHLLKRSIDARQNPVKINIRARLFIGVAPEKRDLTKLEYDTVSEEHRVIIIGCGPAGMFAALRCIEKGLKPIIIERGKDVQSRRRDLKAINRDHVVDPDSNYCFGEGGAGTYSDGKLYTRSKKRGNVKRVLDILHYHGAVEDILIEAHPHIGTNKLPKVVEAMRETILECGGEIHFEQRVTELEIANDVLRAVKTHRGDRFEGKAVILATGHSARDIFELLHKNDILIEAKPFAMGVRIEHPQDLIDGIQYNGYPRGQYLPAASYKLVDQVDDRGVYSFCMCPGGFVVPAATAPGELVVNGMSPSKRDNQFANSGIVVAVELADLKKYREYGPLAGMMYQKESEQAIWRSGGSTQTAPAQRMTDFTKARASSTLNSSSYKPGLSSVPMQEVLPDAISTRLQKAFMKFGKKMPGYYTEEANIIGIESRTSSPVRIPRDPKNLRHPQISNLFPCGEGAGYAGGIVSAGIDGERCADAVYDFLNII